MGWNRQRSAIQNHEGKEWLLSADGGSCEEDTLRRAVTFSVRTQTAQGDCIGKETGINTLSLQDHLSEGESLAEKEQEAKHGEWVWGERARCGLASRGLSDGSGLQEWVFLRERTNLCLDQCSESPT